jgi:MFS transporter, NNP family, nitrate/nitrite transporter
VSNPAATARRRRSWRGAPERTDAGGDVSARNRVLWLSFTAFMLTFAAWLMFGVLGVPIQLELELSDPALAWLAAVAILNGSLWRLPFGMLADRYGGKKVVIVLLVLTSASAFLVSSSRSYTELLVFAFLVGLGGNMFAVGSAWNAAWFPPERQGFAMGLFGAGNVGAAVTKLIGPTLIAVVPAASWAGGWLPGGWRFIPFLYGWLLLAMAGVVALCAPGPDRRPSAGRSLGAMLRPLSEVRIWRFGLYYTVVFGSYVAMSAWLPKYYLTVYDVSLTEAALLTTPFVFASSLLRPLGGWLSDRYDPRNVTYGVFIGGAVMALALLLPLDVTGFTICAFALGVTQGIGKASTIKYIPEYYPRDVGAVVGLVGSLAALGGFAMPPLFAYLNEWSGEPRSMFCVVFALSLTSLIWLHSVVSRMPANERLLRSQRSAPLATTASIAGVLSSVRTIQREGAEGT